MLPAHDEIVIMPGSVLTALSGGKIEPLYHQVRNHQLDDRQSIMYFVNPEIDEPLFGWIESGDGERADIREHVQNAPSMFGLPPVEALCTPCPRARQSDAGHRAVRCREQPDVIVVGAGLAGLVATYELTQAGRHVVVVDQENRANLGGQAFWSLGGLFMVDTPEQRRMGIKDSYELALHDWLGTAGVRPRARGPLAAAVGRGLRPLRRHREAAVPARPRPAHHAGRRLGRARRRPRGRARQLGAALPPDLGDRPRGRARLRRARARGREARAGDVPLPAPGRRLVVEDGATVGVRGTVLEPSDAERGVASSRVAGRRVRAAGQAVVVTSGGIGGNHELVRKNWPADRLGPAPESMITGVPAHVDGRMLEITEGAGGNIVNRDRMWHYVEGINNWDPIWPDHAIRIIPGPSSMWFDATGRRLPAAVLPRLRHPAHAARDPGVRLRLLVVRAQPDDHREGVRAVRVGAEPRHHRQGPEADAEEPRGQGRARADRGVQGARRRLRRRATTCANSSTA